MELLYLSSLNDLVTTLEGLGYRFVQDDPLLSEIVVLEPVTIIYRRQTTLSTDKMENIFMTNTTKNPSQSDPCSSGNNGAIYEIKIKGLLDDHWSQWFEGMTLERQENAEAGQDCTLIIGPIADQPALHGLLAKIRDLNLTLISVRELDPKDWLKRERGQEDTDGEPS